MSNQAYDWEKYAQQQQNQPTPQPQAQQAAAPTNYTQIDQVADWWDRGEKIPEYFNQVGYIPPERYYEMLKQGATEAQMMSAGRYWQYLYQQPEAWWGMREQPIGQDEINAFTDYGNAWQQEADLVAQARREAARQPRTRADNQMYVLPVDTATKMFGDISQFQQDGTGNVYIPEGAAQQLPTYQPEAIPETVNGMPKEQWDAMPGWMKLVAQIMPALQTGFPTVMGALAGSPFGPLGMAAGAALGFGSTKLPGIFPGLKPVGDFFNNAFQWGSMQVEQGLGFASQIILSLQDPDTYGPVSEILEDPNAAYQGGQVNLDAASFGIPVVDEKGVRFIGYNYDPKTGKQTIENWEIGKPTPTTWTVDDDKSVGGLAMAEARRRIHNAAQTGETTEEIVADIAGRFGYAGMIRDMVGQMVLDPLNLFGDVANATGAKIAKAAGKMELAQAFERYSQIGSVATQFKRGLAGEELLKVGNAMNNDILDALRDYGIKTNMMPLEDRARLSSFEKWLGDLNKEGIPNILDKEAMSKRKGLANVWYWMMDSARGLDAKSRASEITRQMLDGLKLHIAQEGIGKDPSALMRHLYAIAKMTPEAGIQAMDANDLPSMFNSIEFQFLPQAIRDQVKKLTPMVNNWNNPENVSARNWIGELAADLQIEPNKLIKEINDASPEQTEAIIRALFTTQQQAGMLGNPEAAAAKIQRYLTPPTPEELQKGARFLTPQELKLAAGRFTKDADSFYPEMFTLKVLNTLEDGLEEWAVEWFGVKPPHWAIRTSDAIKKAQSLVLLGLNPSYFLNNAINNVMMLAWDGLIGKSSITGRTWLKEMGLDPTRLRSGASAADIGEIGDNLKMGRAIHKASRGNDFLQKISDAAEATKGLGFFSAWSQHAERWASEIAFTNAMKQYWDKHWMAGIGFDKMPADLRQVVDGSMGQGTAARIEKLVQRGKSKADIEKQIFKNFKKPNIKDVMKPDDLETLNHFPETVKKLETKLETATSSAEVRQAFQETRREVLETAGEKIIEAHRKIAEEATATVQVEGFHGMARIKDDLDGSRYEFWYRHLDFMGETARRAEAATTSQERNRIWKEAFDEADMAWNQFRNLEAFKWQGMFKAFAQHSGDAAAYEAQALQVMWDQYDNWNAFFMRRKELWNEYRLMYDNLKPSERKQRVKEINAELNREYLISILTEDQLQGILDQHIIAGAQLSGVTDFDTQYWRITAQTARRRMTAANLMFRTGKVPAEIKQAWGNIIPQELANQIRQLHDYPNAAEAADMFWREIYQKQLLPALYNREQTGVNYQMRGEDAGGVAPAPTPQPGTTETPKADAMKAIMEQAKAAGIVDQRTGEGQLQYLTNVINKYLAETGQNPITDQDVVNLDQQTIDLAIKAHQDRVAERAAQEAANAEAQPSLDNLKADLEAKAQKIEENTAWLANGLAQRWGREAIMKEVHDHLGEQAPAIERIFDQMNDEMKRRTGKDWFDEVAIIRGDGLSEAEVNAAFQAKQDWYYSQLQRQAESRLPATISIEQARTIPGTVTAERELRGVDPATVGRTANDRRIVRDGKVYIPGSSTPDREIPGRSIKQQVLDALGNVKPDELRWTGLLEFLDQADAEGRTVSKAEILAHLQENRVKITEKLLTDNAPMTDDQVASETEVMREFMADHEGWTPLEEGLRAAGIEIDVNPEDAGIIGFYDGAEILTSEEVGRFFGQETGDLAVEAERMWRDAYHTMPDNYRGSQERTRYTSMRMPGGTKYRELVFTWDTPENLYSHSHWDDTKNPIAHVRFDQRFDTDGKKVLFMEEVQSDWHQAGRERGYAPRPQEIRTEVTWENRIGTPTLTITHNGQPSYTPVTIEEYAGKFEVRAGYKIHGTFDTLEEAKQSALENPLIKNLIEIIKKDKELKTIQDNAGKIPAAPFQNSWDMLVMKRMVRWAAENGFDKIAWPTGPQAARIEGHLIIDQVDRLVYQTEAQRLQVYKNGRMISSEHIPDPSEISKYVGDDIAEQLLAQPGSTKDAIRWSDNGYVYIETEESGWITFNAYYADLDPDEVAQDIKRAGVFYGAFDENGDMVDFGLNKRELQLYVDENMSEDGEPLTLRELHLKVGPDKVLETKNVTFGGKKMRWFYDRNLINDTNNFIKKWGVEVGPVDIGRRGPAWWKAVDENGLTIAYGTDREVVDNWALTIVQKNLDDNYEEFDAEHPYYQIVQAEPLTDLNVKAHPDFGQTIVDQNGNAISPILYDDEQVGEYLSFLQHEINAAESAPVDQGIFTSHGFDITPQMKEEALAGLPLFQRGKDQRQKVSAARAEELKQWLQDGNMITPDVMAQIMGKQTPAHVLGVAQFITDQRRKLVTGQITTRDIAKALLMTAASQGAAEKPLASYIAAAAELGVRFDIPSEFVLQKPRGEYIRPEEAMAAWLMSPRGKQLLDAIEAGAEIPEDLITEARNARKPFNDDRLNTLNVFGQKGTAKNKYNLTNLKALAEQVNALGQRIGQGDAKALDQMDALMMRVNGVGEAKMGFIKHLLGLGDTPTIDAQEINAWIMGKGTSRAKADAFKMQMAEEVKLLPDKDTRWLRQEIMKRFETMRDEYGIGAGIEDGVFQHTMHHWLWDRMKNTETTHIGMYKAQRLAQPALGSDAAKGLTGWMDNGKAIIHIFEAGDVSTFAHEALHAYTPHMSEADARIVKQWYLQEYGEELPDDWHIRTRAAYMETRDIPQDLRGINEAFARGFERYWADGPTAGMRYPGPIRQVFEKMKVWLLKIYRSITGSQIDVNVTPELREVFDRWMGAEPEATFKAAPEPPSSPDWLRAQAEKELEARYRDFFGQTEKGPLEQGFKRDIERKAFETFPATYDMKKAGFIARDGRMLDMSEGYNWRTLDHASATNRIYGLPQHADNMDDSIASIWQFMGDTGAVRIAAYDLGGNYAEVTLEGNINARQAQSIQAALERDKVKQVRLVTDNSAATVDVSQVESTLTRKRFGLFQADTQRWYYSQLRASINAKMPGRAQPEQIRGMLKGLVKDDEMKWTGFDEWLDQQKGPVSKADVLDFLDENEVIVEEELKGINGTGEVQLGMGEENAVHDIDETIGQDMRLGYDQVTAARRIAERHLPTGYTMIYTPDEMYHSWEVVGPDGAKSRLGTSFRASLDMAINLVNPMDTPKWENMVMRPKGVDYRELILTLPPQKKIPADSFNHPSHWGSIENPLVHIRFDTRETLDGKKVLLINEMQSDWHQQGRERGYKADLRELRKQYNALGDKIEEIEKAHPELSQINARMESVSEQRRNIDWADDDIQTRSRYRALGDEYDSLDAQRQHILKSIPEVQQILEQQAQLERRMSYNRGVQPAPFENTWDQLAMKRIIRWAAENRFDQVAWVTGPQAAKLEGHQIVTELERLEYDESSQRLLGYRMGRQDPAVVQDNVAPNQLAQYIGDDAAKQLMGSKSDENFAWAEVKAKGRNNFAVKTYNDRGQPVEIDYLDENEARLLQHNINRGVPIFLAEDFDGIMAHSRSQEDLQRQMEEMMVERWNNDISGNRQEVSSYQEILDAGQEMNQEYTFRIYQASIKKNIRTLKTGDISFGGEKMRWFYDRNLVNNTNKTLKKWGQQVKKINIGEAGGWWVENLDGESLTDFYPTRAEAMEAGRRMFAQSATENDDEMVAGMDAEEMINAGIFTIEGDDPVLVNGFDVSLDMQESALQAGLPLFQIQAPNRKMSGDEVDAYARALLRTDYAEARRSVTYEDSLDDKARLLAALAKHDIDKAYRIANETVLQGVTDRKTRIAIMDRIYQQQEGAGKELAKKLATDQRQKGLLQPANAFDGTEAPKQPELPPQPEPGPKETFAYSLEGGKKIPMAYKVVSLDDLVASHDENFKVNPAYPTGGQQPRDRSAKGYQEQVSNIAANLDERILTIENQLQDGPMIVAQDNTLVNGNGRTMALRLARRDYPEKWSQYQASLAAMAEAGDFGLTAADLQGIKDPVLVREVQGGINVIALAREAQASSSAQLTDVERSMTDAAALDINKIGNFAKGANQTLEGALRDVANADMVSAWIQKLPPADRPALLDNNKQLTTQGLTRLKNALFSFVFGQAGQRMNDIFINTKAKGMTKLRDAIYEALPWMTRAEGMIKAGTRDADLSIAGDLMKVIEKIESLRKTKMSIDQYLGTRTLLGAELSPFQEELMRLIGRGLDDDQAITTLLNEYAREVVENQTDPNQMALFSTSRPDPAEILQTVAKRLGHESNLAGQSKEVQAVNWAEMFPADDTAQASNVTAAMAAAAKKKKEHKLDPIAERLAKMFQFNSINDIPRPLSGYTGNKRTMLLARNYDNIVPRSLTGKIDAIFEAFGGSGLLGSVFQERMNKPRILNEYDPLVANFHKVARDNPEAMFAKAEELFGTVLNTLVNNPKGNQTAYDFLRGWWAETERTLRQGSDVDQAVVTLMRWSSLGTYGNVSFMTYSKGKYTWQVNETKLERVINSIREHSKILQKGDVRNGDARDILKAATDKTLVLLDPPYVSRSDIDLRETGYEVGNDLMKIPGALKFINEDMAQAAQKGVPMIYTNNAHPKIIQALEENGFHIRIRTVRSAGKEYNPDTDKWELAKRFEVIAWNDAVGPADAGGDRQLTEELLSEYNRRRDADLANRGEPGKVSANNAGAQGMAAQPNGSGAGAGPAATSGRADLLAKYNLTGGAAPAAPRPGAAGAGAGSAPGAGAVANGPAPERGARPGTAPIGTTDGSFEPPTESAVWEGIVTQLNPALRRAEDALAGADETQARGALNWDEASPEALKAIKKYIAHTSNQMTDTKLAALRFGESKRDFALLNYNRRTGIDNWLGVALPYSFWYTHSARNWALRAMTKPSIYANYQRLNELAKKNVEREGFPTRLKRKGMIRLPFMPSWMGEGIFIDPMKQIFPFEQIMAPWQKLADQRNQETRRAEGILQDWMDNQEYNQDEVASALQTRTGYLWNKAMAEAANEVDGNVQNPLDFAFTMSGPSLPVSIAYNWMTGRKDRISQLPITRGVQAITGAMGIGGPRGVNMEAGIRKAAGLPEVDRFEDYRVDRMLAGMAAEGTIDTQSALKAMIDRSGPAFDLAQQKVSQMGFWQYLGAPVGLDFFPEGEQDSRAMRDVYDKAIKAWKGGDKQALSKFYDEYPEYEARSASFREPQDRLKRFMISEVWDRYNQLPSVDKKIARDQLGPTFADAFINKETRSYDAISLQTLAGWAKALDASNPIPAANPEVPQFALKFAPKDVSAAVDRYNQEMDARFPGIGAQLTQLYQLPPEQQDAAEKANPRFAQYYAWKNKYLAEHPNIIPYVTSEKSELYGLPQDIQEAVYKYRAQREQNFPGIDALQNQYFAIENKDARSAFLRSNPQITEYWDWRRAMAAQTPKAAPYILSDQALQNAILYNQSPAMSSEILQQMSPNLLAQLMSVFYAKGTLQAGAYEELDQIWEQAGRPYGSLQTWITKVVKPSLTGQ